MATSPKKRILAAPSAVNGSTTKNFGRIVLPDNVVVDMKTSVDFRKFEFPELEEFEEVIFDRYVGPTNESNWVIPKILLVGAYPATENDSETFDLLTSILKQGVTTFVCLQEEYPDDDIDERLWRRGEAIRPYYNDLKLIVKNRNMFTSLSSKSVVDSERLKFIHFPIKDCGITDDTRVMNLAMTLVSALSKGEVLYMHCWGGHGRTGTLVSIMLFLMYGLGSVDAMQRCQYVHDIRKCPVVVGSPQTEMQRQQVHRVIGIFQDLMLQEQEMEQETEKEDTCIGLLSSNTVDTEVLEADVSINIPASPTRCITPGEAGVPTISESEVGDLDCSSKTNITDIIDNVDADIALEKADEVSLSSEAPGGFAAIDVAIASITLSSHQKLENCKPNQLRDSPTKSGENLLMKLVQQPFPVSRLPNLTHASVPSNQKVEVERAPKSSALIFAQSVDVAAQPPSYSLIPSAATRSMRTHRKVLDSTSTIASTQQQQQQQQQQQKVVSKSLDISSSGGSKSTAHSRKGKFWPLTMSYDGTDKNGIEFSSVVPQLAPSSGSIEPIGVQDNQIGQSEQQNLPWKPVQRQVDRPPPRVVVPSAGKSLSGTSVL